LFYNNKKGGVKMEELVNLFLNNGTAIACLIYFMWYNNTTMNHFTDEMKKMNETLVLLLHKLSDNEK
jgi:hypothetical protein